jgi:hypothetical protein
MYELTLLGPVTLRRLGVVVPLATAKAAALLVLLALGGPAHRARIAGWLWPSVDDAAARRNLRRELARLREAGVGELLRSDGDVLALAGAPLLRCDAWAFREAAVSPHELEVESALALWRGPPAGARRRSRSSGAAASCCSANWAWRRWRPPRRWPSRRRGQHPRPPQGRPRPTRPARPRRRG